MGSWKKKIEDRVRKKYVLTSEILKKSHAHKPLEFFPPDVCGKCGGQGTINGSECPHCEGTGEEYK